MTPTQKAAMEMALEALKQAKDAVSDWGSYASDYFQKKHDLQGDLDAIQAQITAIRAALAEQSDDKAVRYGCHCDLEPHMEPDGCVLDDGRPWDCVYARRPGATKEGCEYWKPIVIAARIKP
jgi:hypothetical protein